MMHEPTQGDRILRLFRHGADFGPAEVAELLGASRISIQKALSRLQKEGVLERVTFGRYRMAETK